MLGMIWKGILLGLGAAAPIGPVNVEIARRSLRHGFWAGFLLGCGAVTVDVTYAVLVSVGVRPVLKNRTIAVAMGIGGAAVLVYLGVMCLIGAVREYKKPFLAEEKPHGGRHYIEGLMMTAVNPMTLVFWLTIAGVAGTLSNNPAQDLPWICLGVFTGAFSWVCFFTSLMTFAGRAAKRTTALVADLAGGVMLLGFAALAIGRVWRGHL